jgi:hypothetical protein
VPLKSGLIRWVASVEEGLSISVNNNILREQYDMLWEPNSMLWEQNNKLLEQDIILREQN